MKTPKIIFPENYDVEAGYKSVGEDICVCSCPACGEYYAMLGHVIECECGFQFPVDWWPQYSWGSQAAVRVADGGRISGGMKHRCQLPYYRYGFEHPTERPTDEKKLIDWRTVMAGVEPKSMGMLGPRFANCDHCGKLKPPPRHNSSKLCVECDAETSCVHYQPEGPLDLSYVCKAGVKVGDLTGIGPGCWTRQPCRYIEGGCPVSCEKFQPHTIEQMHAEDAAWEKNIAEFMLVGPVIAAIKAEHKGKNWQGAVECPVCKGKLHLSHAASNGHCWGKCETEDCLCWLE